MGTTDGPVGLVLAAGGGSRFGGPKVLARRGDGAPWVLLAVRLLRAAGCDEVLVVLGAAEAEARALVGGAARVVVVKRWTTGMGASLAAGLAALPEADAALITLVDLPGMPVAVPERLLAGGSGRSRLARAAYAGSPGHPVLAGRDHWAGLGDSVHGDAGGRVYLAEHGVERIECGDLFDGADVDTR